MSPRRKSKPSRPKRKVVRSKDMQIVVRGVRRSEPDIAKLAKVVLEEAKDRYHADLLGITVDELRRRK